MPYVARGKNGRIVAVHRGRTAKATEKLSPGDAELAAFLLGDGGPGPDESNLRQELAASDLEFVRVLEDLLAVLINKGVIMLTDLPEAARRKLLRRRGLRVQISDLGGIVAEGEDILLP